MAESYTGADGSVYIRRPGQQGGWRQATEDESNILAEGSLEAVGRSALESFKGTAGLLQTIASFNSSPIMGPVNRQAGLNRMAESQQQLELRGSVRPEATAGGEALAFAGEELLPGGLIAGAIRNRAAKSVARRAARNTADVVEEVPSPDAASFGRLLDDLPQAQGRQGPDGGVLVDDVAEVSAKADGSVDTTPTPESLVTLDAIGNVPRWQSTAQGIREKLFKGTGTSRDQAKLIESGVVERSGFRLLPGQRSGSNVVADMVETLPNVAEVFSPTLTANARNLAEKVSKSVGLEADDWGRDILGASRARVGEMFDNVEAMIPDTALGDDLARQLDEGGILTSKEAKAFGIDPNTPRSGADLMELRSLTNEALSAARKDAAQGVRARELEQTLEQMDDLVLGAIDDPAAAAMWTEARQRWRMVLALDRPGVVSPEGDISLKRLTGAIEKQFPNEFRRTLGVKGDKLPPDMVELMEYTRVARTFASNLPNSGTATRNWMVKLATTPQVAAPLGGAAFFAGLVGE